MKKRVYLRIGVLLMVTLCAVLLTGCPNVTDQEMAQLTADGEELLKQALLENYGWESQDYQLVSWQVTPSSAAGFSYAKYQLKKDGVDFAAYVDISCKKVFTDWYGEEFGKFICAYLEQRIGESPAFRDKSIQITSVTFKPPVLYAMSVKELGSMKVIPATVTPEGFEEYLKECEQGGSLIVIVKVAWYAESQEEIQEDLLTKRLMSPSGKFPDTVIIEHFVGESE